MTEDAMMPVLLTHIDRDRLRVTSLSCRLLARQALHPSTTHHPREGPEETVVAIREDEGAEAGDLRILPNAL